MAQRYYADLEGVHVSITNVAGPFRSCVTCGGQTATLSTKAPGMHAAQLFCDGCGEHTAFLSRDHLAAMSAQRRAG